MDKLKSVLGKPTKSEKFDQWIRRFHGVLYKHALWMVGSQDVAQEVTQETFFQAWKGMGSLKDDDKALPWLLTILRRTIYREQRFQYRNRETMEALRVIDNKHGVQESYALIHIYEVMEQLSPKLRDTFLLYHLHGFSYEEIGNHMEIPVGTVMSRISRARKALQEQQVSIEANVVHIDKVKRGTKHDG